MGWISEVRAEGTSWCQALYVHSKLRRRDVGRALMTRVLREDRRLEAEASVLLASHAGAMLYPLLGYERIGKLCLYAPPRRAARAIDPPAAARPGRP